MSICYPPETDWSCRFSEEELIEAQVDPVMGPLLEKAEAFGWATLASLTAYRIGTCPVTVRPCAAGCMPPGTWAAAPVSGSGLSSLGLVPIGQFRPYISGGAWHNACGCRRDDCSCSNLSEVILPGPVGRIVKVMLDGEVVPRSAYRVDNGDRLVRRDGKVWPACQDMALSDDEGFSVTYYRGAAPDLMTRAAAGALAAEFLADCEGKECRLPGNVVSMSRNGEQYELDPEDFDSLPMVKALIRIYNPHRLKSAPTVVSPDTIGVRTPTWS